MPSARLPSPRRRRHRPPTTTTPPERPVGHAARAAGSDPPRTTVETTTTTTTPPEVAWQRFDEALSGRLIGSGDFAAAVAVAVDGEIVHTSEFGYRVPPPLRRAGAARARRVDRPRPRPWRPDPEPEPIEPGDRFRIASISKVITAIVVLQMVEAGQLGLDDAVGERLAAHVGVTVADPAVAAITVRQLLAHTSGLPGVQQHVLRRRRRLVHDGGATGPRRADSPPRRATYRYSNFNYCLLGLLVEQIAGRPYEAVVTDRLLAPLGIQGMRLARTFDDDPSQVVHPSAPLRNYMEVLGAAGSWVATPSDVVKIMASIDPPHRAGIRCRRPIAGADATTPDAGLPERRPVVRPRPDVVRRRLVRPHRHRRERPRDGRRPAPTASCGRCSSAASTRGRRATSARSSTARSTTPASFR